MSHPLPTLRLGAWSSCLGADARASARRDPAEDLWLIDVETGAERQLTNLSPDFDIRDFDISPDGHEVVLERAQEHSDIVLLDLPGR
jgi:dipeptidyl aminopeptidase/acylaminoacyl peptidase